MYSGEYNVFDVTLSVYPHRAVYPHSNRLGLVAELAEHWTGIPNKGRGLDSHRGQANFSACPVWIYTQSNIKNITSLYCSSVSSLEGEI